MKLPTPSNQIIICTTTLTTGVSFPSPILVGYTLDFSLPTLHRHPSSYLSINQRTTSREQCRSANGTSSHRGPSTSTAARGSSSGGSCNGGSATEHGSGSCDAGGEGDAGDGRSTGKGDGGGRRVRGEGGGIRVQNAKAVLVLW